jgi:hypothetical protein
MEIANPDKFLVTRGCQKAQLAMFHNRGATGVNAKNPLSAPRSLTQKQRAQRASRRRAERLARAAAAEFIAG